MNLDVFGFPAFGLAVISRALGFLISYRRVLPIVVLGTLVSLALVIVLSLPFDNADLVAGLPVLLSVTAFFVQDAVSKADSAATAVVQNICMCLRRLDSLYVEVDSPALAALISEHTMLRLQGDTKSVTASRLADITQELRRDKSPDARAARDLLQTLDATASSAYCSDVVVHEMNTIQLLLLLSLPGSLYPLMGFWFIVQYVPVAVILLGVYDNALRLCETPMHPRFDKTQAMYRKQLPNILSTCVAATSFPFSK